jgi:3-oxoacyl-[acyl-carrier protein] reductase
MADRYQQLINTPIGRIVSKQVGLPAPEKLERYERGQPGVTGPVLLGAAPGGRLLQAITQVLGAINAEVHTPMDEAIRTAAADAGLDAGIFNPEVAREDETFKALVFDATGIATVEQLREAWAFFHPTIRRVQPSGRVIVLATPPEAAADPLAAVAERALEGLTRSIGKEVRRGSTSQLIYVAPKAEDRVESSLRFFLSPKSAYVSGQVVRITPTKAAVETVDWERPLAGKIALVTGASRGIGASIADVLARDGAHVIGVDVPAMGDELEKKTSGLGGSSLTLDITDDDAPARIASHLLEHHGGVDVIVHNAGITRDKTLGRMTQDLWDAVIEVNLHAPLRIDGELNARDVIRDNGRMILVSSISGIAGNAGQTNYGTSKAGVIGAVQAFAPLAAKQGNTVNAVAPGFIESQMTAAMPIAAREAGRRMNSLSQGGLPVDVAETIAWLASPASAGVNGNIVRVCGQSLIGA